jgi:hypothetical protein
MKAVQKIGIRIGAHAGEIILKDNPITAKEPVADERK